MNKIRVLIVDDSAVIRKLLNQTLSSDPDIEIIGTAGDGSQALLLIKNLNPDLVTLDIEMPEMDGLTTLVEIRKTHPRLPVIMVSALAQRAAAATLDALSKGANDYVTKPSNQADMNAAMTDVRNQLIPKIKLFCRGEEKKQEVSSVVTTPTSSVKSYKPKPIDLVAIGVSTGGPNALAEVFPKFSKNFSVPIVMVQHMPPVFTKLLAERLSENSPIKIEEAVDGSILEAGKAILAPGGFHMVLKREGNVTKTYLNQDPPENSCRPAVDVLFRSVASLYGGNVLAVILTGMGEDGLKGCQLLKNLGAQVYAQDEATSVVWGMPGAVTRAGLADKVLPLNQISDEIMKRVLIK